jgi:hypothetical protein
VTGWPACWRPAASQNRRAIGDRIRGHSSSMSVNVRVPGVPPCTFGSGSSLLVGDATLATGGSRPGGNSSFAFSQRARQQDAKTANYPRPVLQLASRFRCREVHDAVAVEIAAQTLPQPQSLVFCQAGRPAYIEKKLDASFATVHMLTARPSASAEAELQLRHGYRQLTVTRSLAWGPSRYVMALSSPDWFEAQSLSILPRSAVFRKCIEA